MLIPVGFAQVNLKFSGTGQPLGGECTYGLDITGYGGDPADAALLIGNAWGSEQMDVLQSSSVTLASVLVKYGPNATGPSAEVAAGFAGTQTTPVSPNTSWLVQKRTALGGKAGRGRMYIPGIPESVVDASGVIDTSYVNSSQTHVSDFFLLQSAADLIPVLLHGPDSPIGTPTVITSFDVQFKVATQRRRLRR